MKRTKIAIDPLTGDGLDEAIRAVEELQNNLEVKVVEFLDRLTETGVHVADVMFSTAQYDGPRDVTVRFENRGDFTRAVVATGETALILEFGAGVTLGYGHPEAAEHGMGPATYPGQVHAEDPRGWYLPKAAGGGHTYGNPPAGAMHGASREIEIEFERIAREVFGSA